ncbi:Clp protease N-terminal domain-containing protein [Cellulomonas citrea]|uniref:Clp protease N-terminal domain-containing protein n=1 Tax=Cellulomonas citrea TaxID=1909423 RepID=UPI001358074D|nr:Clp protease N-terminal domain-containing protein [Cellulomonas citrea]
MSGRDPLNLSRRATYVLAAAKAIGQPRQRVGSGELLAALADDVWGPAGITLARCGADVDAVVAGVEALQELGPRTSGTVAYSPVLGRVLRSATGYAPLRAPITTEHLLLGLLDEPDSVAATILEVLGVRVRTIRTGLADVDPVLAASDGDGPGARVLRWPESIELSHPPSSVWALIEPPEHAHLLAEGILSGARRQPEAGREIHELVVRPGGPGDRVLLAVERAPSGLGARVRQIEPVPAVPFENVHEVTPTIAGSLLRLTCVVDVDDLRPQARYLGRRVLGRIEAGTRTGSRDFLDRVAACLDGGWAPQVSGVGDASQ